MAELHIDRELKAIQSIIAALEPLDTEARKRVADYVSRRLNLSFTPNSDITSTRTTVEPILTPQSGPPTQIIDIRSLREQKKPSSANEMAALVAFYLAEFAPLDERKSTIEKADIEKYFKQAGFPLPKVIRQTLINATKSGYFDTTGGGRYRLNPVGYNLVVHGLPSKGKMGK